MRSLALLLLSLLALPTSALAAPDVPAQSVERDRSERRDDDRDDDRDEARERKARSRHDRARHDRARDAAEARRRASLRHAEARHRATWRSDGASAGPVVVSPPPVVVVRRHHVHRRPYLVVEAEPSPVAEVRTERRAPRDGRTVRGDLSARFGFVGGGLGMVGTDGDAASSLRFTVGGGAYTWFLYGSGSFDLSGSPSLPVELEAAGAVGVAFPVPVFHPMLGVRGAAGAHMSDQGMLPHVDLGPQFGFVLREFDGKIGVRLMIDVDAEIRPVEQTVLPEGFVTVSMVF